MPTEALHYYVLLFIYNTIIVYLSCILPCTNTICVVDELPILLDTLTLYRPSCNNDTLVITIDNLLESSNVNNKINNKLM